MNFKKWGHVRFMMTVGAALGCSIFLMGSKEGCGKVGMILDLSGYGNFYDLPHPSNLRLDDRGHPMLEGFPNPRFLEVLDQMRGLAEEELVGWSPSGPIYLPLTGLIDTRSLSDNPEDYTSCEEPIVLVDIDPASVQRGRCFPIQVNFNLLADSYRRRWTLQVLPVPGIELLERTTYALILTDAVETPPGFVPSQPEILTQLLQGNNPGGDLGEKAVRVYAPLARFLEETDFMDPDRMVGATVFTTGFPTERLFKFADWASHLPAPVANGRLKRSTLDLEEDLPYCIYEGSWEVPLFQQGVPPYFSEGGEFKLDAHGNPVIVGYRTAPFVVTIPKTEMPSEGFPLLFYIHERGGSSDEVYNLGPIDAAGNQPPGQGPALIAAEKGWASSGMAAHLSYEHIGPLALGGFALYNFLNPRALRDNFSQLVIEHLLFRRLMRDLTLDHSLCPKINTALSRDGKIRLHPNQVVIMGQSQGAFASGLLNAVDPLAAQGMILSGAGGSWIEFPLGLEDPVDLQWVLENLIGRLPPGESLDVWHPVLALFDLSLGQSDVIHFLDRILRRPPQNRSAPHVFVISGHEDRITNSGSQRAFVASLGVDLIGPEVAENPEDQLLPVIELAGGDQLSYPASGNFFVPRQGPRTAGVVRYLEDGIRHGHWVAFQLDEPKQQYGYFLETLIRDGIPTIEE
ncbi:MAG: hypothetical protein HY538_01965 [Deltaproteobacteria bacterium]|nr:hypothetical protein [Deltaproteobacteria bacterium]